MKINYFYKKNIFEKYYALQYQRHTKCLLRSVVEVGFQSDFD